MSGQGDAQMGGRFKMNKQVTVFQYKNVYAYVALIGEDTYTGSVKGHEHLPFWLTEQDYFRLQNGLTITMDLNDLECEDILEREGIIQI
jgi:hypothetical protein